MKLVEWVIYITPTANHQMLFKRLNIFFFVQVSYPIYNMKATPGGEINALEARKKPPKVRWNGRRNGIYTMIMISKQIILFSTYTKKQTRKLRFLRIHPLTGPDIWGDGNPENKSYCEWDPWVVVNIPGRKMLKGNTVKKYKIPEKPRRDGNNTGARDWKIFFQNI